MAEFTVDLIETSQRVHTRIGDSVWLCLVESPTTGYVWSRTGDLPPGLMEKADDYRGVGAAMGGSAKHCFLYSCEAPCNVELTFVLRRPWAPDVEKEVRVQLTCAT